jgi:hypothetical protein
MALQVFLEAEFEDGHIAREDEADCSAFVKDKNFLYDLLNGLYAYECGAMVRFALVTPDKTYSIDWRTLPGNARPIRFKHMARRFNETGEWAGAARLMSVDFGYQYTDSDGRNVQEVQEIVIG